MVPWGIKFMTCTGVGPGPSCNGKAWSQILTAGDATVLHHWFTSFGQPPHSLGQVIANQGISSSTYIYIYICPPILQLAKLQVSMQDSQGHVLMAVEKKGLRAAGHLFFGLEANNLRGTTNSNVMRSVRWHGVLEWAGVNLNTQNSMWS